MARLALSLLLVLWLSAPAQAQLGLGATTVWDPWVYAQAFTTAMNSIEQVQHQIQDLASLVDLADFVELLSVSQDLLTEVNQISSQLSARHTEWGALMDLSTFQTMAPADVPAALFAWNQRAMGLMGLSSREAQAAQVLLSQAVRVLSSLTRWLQSVGRLTGSVSGLQTLVGVMSAATDGVVRLQAMTATYHQAMQGRELIQVFHEQVAALMAQHSLVCWGQFLDTCQQP